MDEHKVLLLANDITRIYWLVGISVPIFVGITTLYATLIWRMFSRFRSDFKKDADTFFDRIGNDNIRLWDKTESLNEQREENGKNIIRLFDETKAIRSEIDGIKEWCRKEHGRK